jgi:hypothetical protein
MTILIAVREAASMVHRKKFKHSKAKAILRLPDLKQAKNDVLHSLTAPSLQESYGHAIDEFIACYCSERGWCLTEPSSFATGSFWNRRTSPCPQSTCG